MSRQDAGVQSILFSRFFFSCQRYMKDVGIEDGICQLGYTAEDIPGLVEATLPQHRVTKLSPRPVDRPELTAILENSLSIY